MTRGRILDIQSDRNAATVVVEAANACARCAAGTGCGAGLLGSSRASRQIEAPIIGQLGLRVGDEVQLELAPQNVLRAALEVYGAPLAGLLLMVGLAYLGGLSDGQAALAGVAGIGLGAALSRFRLRRTRCLREFTPAITRRLAGAE